MFRLSLSLIPVIAVFCFGCKPENKPTVFESKHDEHGHGHSHEHNKTMFKDFGQHHVGLTAHLSKKDGNELDIVFETIEDKPLPLPLDKFTAKATRAGDEKSYTLEFEPAEKEERKDDPEGKCSRFSAKAPWMKRDDMLTVTLSVPIEGQLKGAVWTDFSPKQFAHHDDDMEK